MAYTDRIRKRTFPKSIFVFFLLSSILTKFTSKRKDGVLRKAYMDLKGSMEIQKEAAKLLKVTTIMPYKSMGGIIIEEIDDE